MSTSPAYGDFLLFENDKIENFGTGYQLGNNSWETRFYHTNFTNNGTGWNVPSNITNSGENVAMFGGAFQNGTTAVVDNNANSDLLLDGVSFDSLTSGIATDGNGNDGGGSVLSIMSMRSMRPHQHFGPPLVPLWFESFQPRGCHPPHFAI
jgi:hypothetical protein